VPSEAINKADCVSFWRETLLQIRFNDCYIVNSYLMLSCLGFSLTWDRSSWYVRLKITFRRLLFVQLNRIVNYTTDSSWMLLLGHVVVVIQISGRSHKDLHQLWTGSSIILHNKLFRIVDDLQFDKVALTFKFQPISGKGDWCSLIAGQPKSSLLRLVVS
jgi:hypothetical protein